MKYKKVAKTKILNIKKTSEFSEFRKISTLYARNTWFGIGVVASHITARMIKENADSEEKFKTLDFILRIDEPYLSKDGKQKIDTQRIKIVITSKKIMEDIMKAKLIRGDIIDVRGKIIAKELSKETGYNRTIHIQVSNFVEHDVNIIHKSKIDQPFEIFGLEDNKEKTLHE